MPAIDGVASHYRSFRSLEPQELRQEGVVGLLRAARRYEQRYETPFWGYASWWVRQAMQRLVAELTTPVVLSDRAARNLVEMKRARSAFFQANQREPTESELARSATMPLEQVQRLISVERAPSSLQARLPGDEKTATTFFELLADPHTEEDYERIVDLVDGEHIRDFAAGLEERERYIVFAHYGIGCRQRTLREIGGEFDLSVERIRQLEERALDKLRQAIAWPPGRYEEAVKDRARSIVGSKSRQPFPRAYQGVRRQAVPREGGDMALPVSRSAGAPLAVEQWDPFRELMQGVFGNAMQNGQTTYIPRFDIEETEDAWIVEAELPGVKRKDVDVEVRDGELLISGEIKERERVGMVRHRTRRTGKFEIRVALPADADPEQVDAKLDRGVMSVEIPKPERVKPRKVTVGGEEESEESS